MDKAFDMNVTRDSDGFSLTDWPFKVIDSVWCCHGDSRTVITFVCQGVQRICVNLFNNQCLSGGGGGGGGS